VSSAFTTLISKIENYYADHDYTTEDAEYLSRLAIVEYAKEKNALVASARQVPETSIDNIIETAIHFNLDADPSEWMLFAANAVDNVLNYSHHGIIASGLGEYTDFLPLGHPSRTNRGAMTASALSQLTALWVAGDPRIASEQARLDVYSAYATKPGSVEADYASAKLGALVAAGYVPEDVVLPVTAAFKMSFAMRSAMAKALAAVRRRHRDGRFAEEFGRLRGFFKRGDGSIFSEDGRIVGAPAGTNNFQIEIKDSPEIPDGIYTIDAAKTAPVKAILSKRALSKVKGLKANRSITNPSKADIASAIPLEDFLKTRADAPEGWTKNEDGSFTSKTGQTVKAITTQPKGDYMVEGAGESGAIDPNTPMFEIRDKNGELLGVGQNWAGLNKIAMTYDALSGEGSNTPDEPGLDQKAGGSNLDSLVKELKDASSKWMDEQRFSPDEYDEATDAMPDPAVTADFILQAEKSGDTSELKGLLDAYEERPYAEVLKKAIERIDGEKGLDQKPGEGKNWYDNTIDFDHLSDPANWKGFKEGTHEYVSPDGKLELTWEPDGEPDMGDGATDLSGISVTYDGQPIGSYLASYRDLEDGDIADGLKDLFKKESWFSPDNLVKFGQYGSAEYNSPDGGGVYVEPKGSKYEVTKSIPQGMIDENVEHSYEKVETYNTKEEAHKAAEDFARLLEDPSKKYDLLYGDWSDSDGGFDQAPGEPTKLSAAGKKIAKDLGDHKFFLEEDADGNFTGGESTYTSPDGRVEVKYRDGSWFDDEKGYVAWDEMQVSVDGKPVDSVLRNKRESWPDFLDRVAAMAENGLENPNYAEEKKAKREADRKAQEDFYNSPEQVEKRARAKWEKEQEEAAQAQARDAADKEGLLKKVDDLANKIFNGESDDSIWVGDEDEEGFRNWGVYNEDGEEVATGNAGPNWDATDIASEIRDGVNSYLDKKMEEEADFQSGFDQKAGEDKAEAPAKPLSEKQMEPATDKQYALLEELNSERDGIDPVTQKAIDDALANKNLTKAQMASLFGDLTKKPFKPNVDPTKPTERQINSLQGYLTTKELTPDEMNDILAQLDAGLDRDSIEKITAKLRRRPDRQPTEGFDQAAGIDSEFDDEYDSAHADVESAIDQALEDYQNSLEADGLSEAEISDKMDEANQIAERLRDSSNVADAQGAERDIANDTTGGIFDKIVEDIRTNAEALDSRKQKNLADADQAKADEVQAAIDGDDSSFLEDIVNDPSYSEYQSQIEDALADINARKGEEEPGFDQASGKTIADAWEGLDQDTKDSVVESMSDYLLKLRQTNPDEFYDMVYDVAVDHPDGKRVMQKPQNYAEDFIDFYANEDPELIADMLENAGVDLDGFDQAPGKTLSPKMMEPATDAQYNYLQSLFDSKTGIDDETAQAVKEALDSKNLTKAQAGGFIGKLRDLGDKENMGQYGKPSQKMIDSVKRDVYAKGLSDADREEILKGLEDKSKGDVSFIISMLKEMDDVEGGIPKYIDSLVQSGDVDALKRLRADDRYGRWSSQMDDALAKMDSGNQGFDQAPGERSSSDRGQMKSDLSSLAEEVENSNEIGYAFLNKNFVDGLDLNDPDDAYYLHAELMDAYKAMRPNSEEGKALEARLKKAADDLLNSIESDLGPIEAAKRDPEDMGSSFEFDSAVDDLPDFFDYYFPTDASSDMRNDPDGGSVGDVRGGGWEASVRFNEETQKWEADMTSPGFASENYSESFDDQDEAADWVANELDRQNTSTRNRDTNILAEDGLAGLIEEYGDDPAELAGVLEGVIGWLRGTNRGQAQKIASTLDDYVTRLREQLAKNPKA
jgi:hypothetical protein